MIVREFERAYLCGIRNGKMCQEGRRAGGGFVNFLKEVDICSEFLLSGYFVSPTNSFHWKVKRAIIVQDSSLVVSEQNRRDVGENFRGFVILGTPQKIRDDMLQISIQT